MLSLILAAAVAGHDPRVRDSALVLRQWPGRGEACRCSTAGCELPPGRQRGAEGNFGLYDELGEEKPAGAAVTIRDEDGVIRVRPEVRHPARRAGRP